MFDNCFQNIILSNIIDESIHVCNTYDNKIKESFKMVVTFKNCFTCWFENVLSENVLNVEFLADVEASVTSDTYNI